MFIHPLDLIIAQKNEDINYQIRISCIKANHKFWSANRITKVTGKTWALPQRPEPAANKQPFTASPPPGPDRADSGDAPRRLPPPLGACRADSTSHGITLGVGCSTFLSPTNLLHLLPPRWGLCRAEGRAESPSQAKQAAAGITYLQ